MPFLAGKSEIQKRDNLSQVAFTLEIPVRKKEDVTLKIINLTLKTTLFILIFFILKPRSVLNHRNWIMRSFVFKSKIWLIIIICCLAFCGPQIFAQNSATPENENSQTNDEQYPRKRKSKQTWEVIVSLPGKLVTLPLLIILKSTEAVTTYFDETKIIARLNDIMASDDGRRGVFPTYSARTGGGLMFYQKLSQQTALTLQATAGAKQRQKFQASIKGFRLGNSATLGLSATYQFLTTEKFYGLGNDSRNENESNYAIKQMSFEIPIAYNFNKSFSIDARVGFESNKIEDGKDSNKPSTTDPDLPGLTTDVELSKVQLTLRYDGKNHPGRPTSGLEFSLSGGVYNEISGNEFGFYKTSWNAATYLNLFYNRVLVLRLAGEITEPLSNRLVPFYHFSEIGQQGTVRGFQRGRFRGPDMILGSIEYRYPIWQIIDFTLFVDAGKVSQNIFDELNLDDYHTGYGAGIRIWGKKGLITKMEIGKSKDGYRFQLVLNN